MNTNKQKSDEQLKIEEIEKKFFGKEGALDLKEGPSGQADEIRQSVLEQEQKVLNLGAQNDPEYVVDRMQEEEILPESIHTPVLVDVLKFLGNKLNFRIVIDNKTVLFPKNGHNLMLESKNLKTFLKRGAIAAGFLMPLLLAENVAFAAAAVGPELNEGDSLIEHVNKGPSQQGHEMFHWEHLVTIFVLIGLSAAVIYTIWRWLKKEKKVPPTTTPVPSKPVIDKKLYDYERAVASGDKKEIEEAKENLMIHTMGELPGDMEDVKEKISNISKKDLEIALKIKKEVDGLINAITQELAEKMLLPEDLSINSLNQKKLEVIDFMDKALSKLSALWDKLYSEFQSLPDGSYLKAQLHIEKQKLNYLMDYLMFIKKKWLICVNEAKQEVLKGHTGEGLEKEDQILKQIGLLKTDLIKLLNQQSGLPSDEFINKLYEIQKKLGEEITNAQSEGIPEFIKEAEFTEGYFIDLENNGYFGKDQPIEYTVYTGPNDQNPNKEVIPLPDKIEIQIWVDVNKKIKMNFTHDGVLVDEKELKIEEKEKRLVIKATGQTLPEYIKEKSENDELKGITASSELPKEAEPVLTALAHSVMNVKNKIHAEEFRTFGEKIDVDDEVIEYHHLRVHKEFYQGKAAAVVKFNLSESYWKNALSHLNKQEDVPGYPVTYNYENEKGAKVDISLPVRRFNIIVNGKQAVVLVTDNTSKSALFGEVRIIFDAKTDFTEDEVKKVFAEVVVKLGIASAIKPVTPEAENRLVKKLQKIRKDNAAPAGKKTVTNEYSAQTATPSEVMKMREMGLHSVYHQFALPYLENIFKVGSLLCTTTRFSKGIFVYGMSSTQDIETGGGTEAFFRIHTDTSSKTGQWYSHGKATLLYKPELLNRMDCYCYTSDTYGSKKPGTYEQRVSPMQLVKHMKSSYNTSNEVMFHDAVATQEAAYLVCEDPASVRARLKKIGVNQIGGKSLEEAVITYEQAKHIKL